MIAPACAAALVELVDPLLDEEQRRAFFAEAYRAVRAAIEAFQIHQNREGTRLCRPMPN